MKTIFVVLLLVLALPRIVHAQPKQGQAVIDSMLTELSRAKQDTANVNLLNALGRKYNNAGELDNGMIHGKNALLLAEKLNFRKGIANSHSLLGNITLRQGSYYDAMMHLEAALKIREELNDQKGMARAYNSMGIVNEGLERYSDALEMYYKALKIYETTGDRAGVRDVHNNMGIIYILMENYPEALESLDIALKICQELGDSITMNHPYNNMGYVYSEIGEYDNALKNFEASYKIRLAMGDKYEIGRILTSIGTALVNQGKYNEAIEKFEESFRISSEVGDKEIIASYYINMGDVYTQMKDYKKAREYLNQSIAYNNEFGSAENLKEIYHTFTEIDSATGNFRDALVNHKKYILYKDSLINDENKRQLMQQQMQYNFDKTEAATLAEQAKRDAIALEELQKQKLVRNAFVAGSFLFLLLAGTIFMGLLKTKKAKKVSEELLLNILPAEVANEIKTTGTAKAKAYTMVTVMFTDFKDFTKVSERVSAELLVKEIDTCFSEFDRILQRYKIEKIKTIGDAYLCASGIPVSNYTHAVDMLNYAFEIRNYMLKRKAEKEAKGEIPFEVRIGIHTGPVVAGIVGVKKYAYDIWGDTVNLAARMESTGVAGKVNISGSTYELVKDKFECTYRGKIEAKNKGEIDMYFVENISNTGAVL